MLIKIKHNISLKPKVLVKSNSKAKAPIVGSHVESNFELKKPRQSLGQDHEALP
jgi:hypothetical protein